MNRDDEALMFRMPENHSNDDVLTLTPDQQAAALTFLQKLQGAMQMIYEDVKKNTLTVSTRFNCVSLMESYAKDIGDALGSEEDRKQSEALRNNQLRAANAEIHRLEGEIAKGVTAEAVGHKIEKLHKVVYDWWHSVGFSYSEDSFSGRYCKVKFSCYFDSMMDSLHEMSPVTNKAKKQQKIQEVGEQVDLIEGRGDDMQVMDTARSRSWVLAQIRGRFPGFRLLNIRSHPVGDNIHTDETALREIEGYIPLEDIEEIEEGSEQTSE